jgi:hypothetical protein
MTNDSDGYEVGYGKPPPWTRFAKGRSGNPKGRRKGQSGPAAVLARIFSRKVLLTVDGKRKRVPVTEAVLLQLTNKAMSGEPAAMREYLRVAFEWQAASDETQTVDQEQLERFVDAYTIAMALVELGGFSISPSGRIKVQGWLIELVLQKTGALGAENENLSILNRHYVVGSPDSEP